MTSSGPDILLRASDLLPLRESTVDNSVAVMGGSVLALLGDDITFPARLAAILAGIEKPWSGRITAGKRGIPVSDKAARRLIGFVQSPPLGPGGMTPAGVLGLVASASGIGPGRASETVGEMIEWCGLTASAGTRLSDLPPGLHFPLAFAAALMHNPCVLIIEPRVPEPFFPHLEAMKQAGKAIVLTGTGVADVPPCTDRVALCSSTDLVRTLVRTELVEMTSGACEIRVAFCPAIPRRLIEEMPGMEVVQSLDSGFRLRHRSPLSAVTWLVTLAKANARTIAGLEIRPPSISDMIELMEPDRVQTLFDESGED